MFFTTYVDGVTIFGLDQRFQFFVALVRALSGSPAQPGCDTMHVGVDW
ncbi:MAG: hypothetical protein WD468_03635 [Pirellulales bacterium]